jgi:hypothetical protein
MNNISKQGRALIAFPVYPLFAEKRVYSNCIIESENGLLDICIFYVHQFRCIICYSLPLINKSSMLAGKQPQIREKCGIFKRKVLKQTQTGNKSVTQVDNGLSIV